MNNNYYPTYPSNNINVNSFDNEKIINDKSDIQKNFSFSNLQFIQDILKINRNKLVTIHFSYPLYNEKSTFNGIIDFVGNDFIIIKDSKDRKYYMLPYYYLNYIEFEEKINYSN